MKKQNQSIIIGEQGKDTKKFYVMIFIIAIMFTAIFTALLYPIMKKFHVSDIWVWVMMFSIFLLIVLMALSFVSIHLRYLEITDEEIRLYDTKKIKQQYYAMANSLFHTHYELPCAVFRIADIRLMKLYAIKDRRVGELFGDAGYCLMLKFLMEDESELLINDWFDYRNSDLAQGIDFLEQKGIPLMDQMKLLDVVRRKESITEYINQKKRVAS